MMDDQSFIEAMDEFEDNIALAETANAVERQIRYQEQIGGNPLAREPGRFVLDVNAVSVWVWLRGITLPT